MDNNLKNYFTEIQTIQKRHLAALNAEISEQDVQKMLFERKRAFENLRNAISLTSVSVRNNFKEEVDKIIEKNKLLTLTLEKHKQELSAMLNHNAKGKRVLKGYQPGTSRAYRFMHTTG